MAKRGGAGRRSEGVGETAEAAIRRAFDSFDTRTTAGFVGLADLRDKLGSSFPRDQIDSALRAMERQEGVRVIPVANTKALTARDRAAGLVIGIDATGRPEVNHAISIAKRRK